jgi:hypothetical protein
MNTLGEVEVIASTSKEDDISLNFRYFSSFFRNKIFYV